MGDTQPTTPPPAEPRRARWLRAASDRVPTKWFTGIGAALVLAATAAFGGLATAAEPPPAELAVGEEHRNDQVTISVQRAVLLDEFPEAGVYVEEGQRVLALQFDVVNAWDQPLPAYPRSSVAQSVALDVLSGIEPDSVARYDDATVSPWLQPGVPVTIVMTWAVDAGAFAGGDELVVTLNDMSLHVGGFVAAGEWWTDPVAAAVVTLELEDLGAGA